MNLLSAALKLWAWALLPLPLGASQGWWVAHILVSLLVGIAAMFDFFIGILRMLWHLLMKSSKVVISEDFVKCVMYLVMAFFFFSWGIYFLGLILLMALVIFMYELVWGEDEEDNEPQQAEVVPVAMGTMGYENEPLQN